MYRRFFYIFVFLFLLAPVPTFGADGLGALISPGKLAKSHAKYEGIKNCTECHVLTGGVQDKKCLDCHDKLEKRIKEKKTPHAKYTDKCIVCHRDHKGRKYQMISLDEEKFDHDDTDYELKFEHKHVECAKCHKKSKNKKNKYSGLKQECAECHDNVHKKQFKGQGCEECHTEKDWEEETFEHDSPEYEGYKLEGKHAEVECAECHVKGRFKPIKTKTCDSALCHKDEHKKQFKGQKCKDCHTVKDWEEETFKHEAPEYKGYKLEGKHRDVKCAECHVKGKYKPIKTKTCDGVLCHNSNEHKDQFKGQSCDECHTVKGWDEDAFDHDSEDYDGYQLEGKHRDVKCAECHIKGVYKPIKETCITCHKDDDEHKDELGKVCETCHTVEDWTDIVLDHDRDTDFPLTGKHNNVECNECHTEKKGDRKIYKNDLFECEDCHDDYHDGEYEEKCKSCHTQYDWEPRNYKHYEKTGYRLEGAHNDTQCTNCHISGGSQFKNVNRVCGQCHLTPHFNQFGGDCSECHSSTNWSPSKFDHALTGFILVGNHRLAECKECHTSRSYRDTSVNCIDCHRNIYNSALDHRSLDYPEDCRICHLTNFTTWDFNHANAGSDCATCHLGEPRDNATHSKYGLECSLCHSFGSNWAWTHPSLNSGVNCSNCHLGYSDIPMSPKHLSNSWFDCETCHSSITTWLPPIYDHTGVTNNCNACHLNFSSYPGGALRSAAHSTDVKFSGLGDTQCEFCHTTDGAWAFVHAPAITDCATCHLGYSTPARSTSVIDHTAFTTLEAVCEECHSGFVAWLPATYNHASATGICHTCHIGYSNPVRTTPHTAVQFGGLGDSDCELCHTTTTAWLPFQHLPAITDCARCHQDYSTPARSASVIDHTAFTTLESACEECHSGFVAWLPATYNNHAGATGICQTCHIGYSNPVRTSPHTAVQFGGLGDSDCELCHSTTAWLPFQHLPAITDCARCHLNYSAPARSTSAIDHTAFTTRESLCEDCHSGFVAWTGGTYDHVGSTGVCHLCHINFSTPARTTPHTTIQFGGAGDNDCELCHTTVTAWLPFQHAPSITDCASCHLSYSTPVQPANHAANAWTACEECHTPAGVGGSWLPTDYHTSTPGVNSGCAACHLNFSSTPGGVLRPASHSTGSKFGGYGDTECELCHTTASWLGADFQHIAGITNCAACHATYSIPAQPANHTTNSWTVCEDCHIPTGIGGSWLPASFNHTGVTTGCNSCHTAYSTPAMTTLHTTVQFGGIGETTCESCHTTTAWLPFQHDPTLTVCATCHLNYSAPVQPANHTTNSWTICEECHAPTGVGGSWLPATYDHTGVTTGCNSCHPAYSTPAMTTLHTPVQFGGIGETTCESCHTTTGAWAFVHNPALTGCTTCHLNYSTPVQPANHTTNSWTLCEECHTPAGVGGSWLPATYDHTGVTTGCNSCHLTYSTPARTTLHTAVQFGGVGETTCENCHTTTGAWVFVHDPVLTGCSTCHLGYSTPPRNTTVNHSNFTNENICEECHSPSGVGGSWLPPNYNHTTVTTGCLPCHTDYTGLLTRNPTTHASYGNNCEDCHLNTGVDWQFAHILAPGVVCNSCHLTYSIPAQPANHNLNGWIECELCHESTTTWATHSYDHTGVTTGCNDCHINYSIPLRTTNHSLARFSGIGDTTCEECHTTTGGWVFVHAPTLSGCSTCHLSYSTPPRNTTVNHSNFTNENICEECHSPSGVGGSWMPPNYNHTTVTTGCLPCHTDYTGGLTRNPTTHAGYGNTCEQCHLNTGVDWQFAHVLAPGVVCNSCHLTYSTPAQPSNHSANGWTDCEVCHHSTTVWNNSISFNHNSTNAPCSSCHLNYTSTTKSAQHNTNGWTVCDECHSPGVNWNYNHIPTTFPLNHEGTNPNNCNECHPNGDYTNSGGCIECHTRKGEKRHNSNQGNAGCLDCHPRGTE